MTVPATQNIETLWTKNEVAACLGKSPSWVSHNRHLLPAAWRRAAPASGARRRRPENWTKKQAEAKAHELERGAELGEATAADVEVATLGDLCRWWLEHWCKPASVKRERSRLSVNVMGHALGATPLKNVTPHLVEARLREMERDGAASAS